MQAKPSSQAWHSLTESTNVVKRKINTETNGDEYDVLRLTLAEVRIACDE